MGKETVIYRNTRENVRPLDRLPKPGQESRSAIRKFGEKVKNKNISKKDSDKNKRFVKHKKNQKRDERKAATEKES